MNHITTAQAAKVLGCHRETVVRYILAGSLPAERVGSMYAIAKPDLEAFIEQQRKRKQRKRDRLEALIKQRELEAIARQQRAQERQARKRKRASSPRPKRSRRQMRNQVIAVSTVGPGIKPGAIFFLSQAHCYNCGGRIAAANLATLQTLNSMRLCSDICCNACEALL